MFSMSSFNWSTFVSGDGGAISSSLLLASSTFCCITATYISITFFVVSSLSVPTIPKSSSPILLCGSTIMFPGCRSAWNVFVSKNCFSDASASLQTIVFLSFVDNVFASDSFVPLR